jgi:hypothetical protein
MPTRTDDFSTDTLASRYSLFVGSIGTTYGWAPGLISSVYRPSGGITTLWLDEAAGVTALTAATVDLTILQAIVTPTMQADMFVGVVAPGLTDGIYGWLTDGGDANIVAMSSTDPADNFTDTSPYSPPVGLDSTTGSTPAIMHLEFDASSGVATLTFGGTVLVTSTVPPAMVTAWQAVELFAAGGVGCPSLVDEPSFSPWAYDLSGTTPPPPPPPPPPPVASGLIVAGPHLTGYL